MSPLTISTVFKFFKFFLAYFNALLYFSTANIVTSFLFFAIAFAIQPEPVPKSKTLSFFFISFNATSTTISVSWRGIKTPGPTLIGSP